MKRVNLQASSRSAGAAKYARSSEVRYDAYRAGYLLMADQKCDKAGLDANRYKSIAYLIGKSQALEAVVLGPGADQSPGNALRMVRSLTTHTLRILVPPLSIKAPSRDECLGILKTVARSRDTRQTSQSVLVHGWELVRRCRLGHLESHTPAGSWAGFQASKGQLYWADSSGLILRSGRDTKLVKVGSILQRIPVPSTVPTGERKNGDRIVGIHCFAANPFVTIVRVLHQGDTAAIRQGLFGMVIDREDT
ncbi:hypothetical protein F5Y19DRAFT_484369 [Xylariaceae sp. FL1651]|nr:hypothetical protein F5Y19DRAFT_484369 [Xylariaceae sp. FL1651]